MVQPLRWWPSPFGFVFFCVIDCGCPWMDERRNDDIERWPKTDWLLTSPLLLNVVVISSARWRGWWRRRISFTCRNPHSAEIQWRISADVSCCSSFTFSLLLCRRRGPANSCFIWQRAVVAKRQLTASTRSHPSERKERERERALDCVAESTWTGSLR